MAIEVRVVNRGADPVEIDSLLDVHITRSQFYAGRLVAGETPTIRLHLKSDVKNIDGHPYVIQPNFGHEYMVAL